MAPARDRVDPRFAAVPRATLSRIGWVSAAIAVVLIWLAVLGLQIGALRIGLAPQETALRTGRVQILECAGGSGLDLTDSCRAEVLQWGPVQQRPTSFDLSDSTTVTVVSRRPLAVGSEVDVASRSASTLVQVRPRVGFARDHEVVMPLDQAPLSSTAKFAVYLGVGLVLPFAAALGIRALLVAAAVRRHSTRG